MAKSTRPYSGAGIDSAPVDNADDVLQNMDEAPPQETGTKDEPLYKVYADSKIPVSKAVGKLWHTKHDAARTAYTHVYAAWEEAFAYYNHNQVTGKEGNITPKGKFRRGNNVENVVYSNVNTVLPAIYSKNPDIAVNVLTENTELAPSQGENDIANFQRALQSLLNRLMRMKAAPGVNLKPKAKKAAMMAELTNMGILKLDFTPKDQSRDLALQQMTELQGQLAKAKNSQEVEQIYGQLQALEAQVETRLPQGYTLSSLLPHNLVVDPSAEEADGSDAQWMIEHAFLPTSYLNARFTQQDPKNKDSKVYVYKPTHKASFDSDNGERDDGLGIVLTALGGEANLPTSYTDQERLSYLYQYMTEVCFVWDKTTRRILLFESKDWTWPIWVWDDYMHTSRFFPYFFIQFALSTGGMVGPGVTSYYLDQQDTINQINNKVNQLRTTYFDYWFYNSNSVTKDEVEKFVKALRGETKSGSYTLGINAEAGQRLGDLMESIGASNVKEALALFDKSDAFQAIDRLAASSDALRGAQFKSNTTQDAVQAYVDATRIRVGAKIDSIEDCIADLAIAMSEICVQFFDQQTVAGLIGDTLAKGWKQCTPEELHSKFTVEIVAGSIEKPSSVFKKKEAIEVVQAIGQFAKVAPGATLLVILRVLQNAFTEVVIKPEEWDMIKQEVINATSAQTQGGGLGVGAPMGPQTGGPPGVLQNTPGGGGLDKQALMALPTPIKAKVMQMVQGGAQPQQVMQFIQQIMKGQGNGGSPTGQQPGSAQPPGASVQ
jgi:hypothetical protein